MRKCINFKMNNLILLHIISINKLALWPFGFIASTDNANNIFLFHNLSCNGMSVFLLTSFSGKVSPIYFINKYRLSSKSVRIAYKNVTWMWNERMKISIIVADQKASKLKWKSISWEILRLNQNLQDFTIRCENVVKQSLMYLCIGIQKECIIHFYLGKKIAFHC